MILNFSSLFTIIFLAQNRPYENDGRNTSEIIGESVVIIYLTFMRCYTDWMEDPEMRYGVALTQIAIISAQVLHVLLTNFIRARPGF
jgi:hypothetical protein